MDKKQSETVEDDLDNRQQKTTNSSSSDIAGSPGSNSNSSSSNRQQRIVELLQDNEVSHECQPPDWIIRPEFYQIDVGQNSDDDSGDDISFIDQELGELGDMDRYGVPADYEESVGEDEDIGEAPSEEDEDEDQDLEYDDLEFVIEPDYMNQPLTDSDDDSDETANYDTTLPVGHRYLGENLEESRGRQFLIEGSTTKLTLINLINIVLFPGQVVPIATSNLNPLIQRCLKSCITRGKTIVGFLSDPQNNTIGTTAEIRNYAVERDEIKLILEGRQRFQLLSSPFEIATEGSIKILPEITLGRPYLLGNSSPLLRFYTNANVPNKFIISKHPSWMLKRYEAANVMLRIMNQIKDWSSVDLTKDPSDFSYWVASNLPISNLERIKALSFSCTEARLNWLLAMLERSDVFGCWACKNVICYKKDIFPMSRSGPQCTYVNPEGSIYDILTVRNTRGLMYYPEWSKEFSWFPGYAWRSVNCDNCSRFIGWCYKRTEPNIKPKKFFGLSRSNIRLLQSGSSEQQQQQPSDSLASHQPSNAAGMF